MARTSKDYEKTIYKERVQVVLEDDHCLTSEQLTFLPGDILVGASSAPGHKLVGRGSSPSASHVGQYLYRNQGGTFPFLCHFFAVVKLKISKSTM